jgi:hypothetical protein
MSSPSVSDDQQVVTGTGDGWGSWVDRGCADQTGPRADRVGRPQLVHLGGQPLPVEQAGEPVVLGVVNGSA